MLNASMQTRPPVPPPPDSVDEEDEEEENDNPLLSSLTVKLPMNYQKGEDKEMDDHVCIPYYSPC